MLVFEVVLLQHRERLPLLSDTLKERVANLLDKLTCLSHEIEPEQIEIREGSLLVHVLVEHRLETL